MFQKSERNDFPLLDIWVIRVKPFFIWVIRVTQFTHLGNGLIGRAFRLSDLCKWEHVDNVQPIVVK